VLIVKKGRLRKSEKKKLLYIAIPNDIVYFEKKHC